MAAPVGHIISALALLGSTTVFEQNAFIAGTNFPDIRYISDISRSATHKVEKRGLSYIFASDSSFEAGRRFHVYVDREREKHMRAHDAYRFINNTSLKTQLLKLVEDEVLFDQLKNKINSNEIFSKIYPEELAYGVSISSIETWHNILKAYLNDTHWFNIVRYYYALKQFKEAYGLHKEFFSNFWTSIRTFGFLVYAYVQVVRLSRNEELRAIILDFYNNVLPALIAKEHQGRDDTTVYHHSRAPPHKLCFMSVTMPRSSSRICSLNPSFL